MLRAKGNPQFARRSRAGVGAPQQQSTVPARYPCPMQGINLYDPLSSMSPGDMVYAYNIVPNEYGLRTRRGYQVHCDDLGSAGNAVRTLIPFTDNDGGDKLFATTVLGIYDVTTSAANPAIDTAFVSQSGDAGYGVHVVYNNDNGDFFVIYADEQNGLYEYDVGAGTWAAKTDITGVSDATLMYVTEHNQRLWFAQSGTMDAWYLGIGAKGGAATKFSLGNKFTHGGELRGIFKWSVDGGDGLDDLLVFVSSAGDVAIYQGIDPNYIDTWRCIGTWYLGAMPDGRRVAENIGGELHLISRYGLISMQDLVSGVDTAKATGANALARRITRAIRTDMEGKSDDMQWDVQSSMAENVTIILRPYDTGETPVQYVFNFPSAGWSTWRGVPINCMGEWKGQLYFGDDVGNVHVMTGTLDGVARSGTGGDPIEFGFLTAYSDFGAPGELKRAQFARPRFFSESGVEPSYNIKFLFDYDINEPALTLQTAEATGDLWDVALWDAGIWGGSSIVSSKMIGGCGYGIMVALAVKGDTTDRTTFLDADVYLEKGNAML